MPLRPCRLNGRPLLNKRPFMTRCNDGQIGQVGPHRRHNRSGWRLPCSLYSRERLCRSWDFASATPFRDPQGHSGGGQDRRRQPRAACYATAFIEVGLNWRDHVDYDSSLVRSSEIICSLGDPSKPAQILDWHSTVKLPEIVARMVRAEREGAASV